MTRPSRRRSARGWLLAAFGLVVVLIAAGCGSSGSDTSTTKSATNAGGKQGSQSQSKRDRAVTAGEQAATKAGAPVDLAKQSVGLIQITGAAESIQRETEAAQAAAAKLGWTVDVCDGQGDPAKMASCATTLLNKKVTLMLVANVEAAPVQAQMKQAKAAGVPWINIGGPAAPSPLFSTQVVEDEPAIGALMAKYVIDTTGGTGTVASTEFPAIFALKQRMDGVFGALGAAPGMKVVSKHTVDFTDLVADVRQWSNSVLTKDPKLSAFALCVDTDPVAVASVVQSRYKDKQYPERPLVVGSLGDLANLDLIRKGQVDAVTETALGATAWMALDQAAEHFARQAEFSQTPQDAYGLPFLKPQLVTKANVPKDPKQFAEPPEDFQAFFTAKWAKEFKQGAA